MLHHGHHHGHRHHHHHDGPLTYQPYVHDFGSLPPPPASPPIFLPIFPPPPLPPPPMAPPPWVIYQARQRQQQGQPDGTPGPEVFALPVLAVLPVVLMQWVVGGLVLVCLFVAFLAFRIVSLLEHEPVSSPVPIVSHARPQPVAAASPPPRPRTEPPRRPQTEPPRLIPAEVAPPPIVVRPAPVAPVVDLDEAIRLEASRREQAERDRLRLVEQQRQAEIATKAKTERAAAAKVKLALMLWPHKPADARLRLQEVARDYPDTEAGRDAQTMLR